MAREAVASSPEVDDERLAECTLALLSLTLRGGIRAWKGFDPVLLGLLEPRGWIGGPRTSATTVVLTEEGQRLGPVFLRKYFARGRC